MKRHLPALTAILLAATLRPAFAASCAFRPADLRCELTTDPLGVDASAPRLSWVLEPTSPDCRGQAQTACRMLVASTVEGLQRGVGDLWDSGKVMGDQSNQVPYGGKPLLSFDGCFWKARAWDRDGNVSEWSAPAHWSMGALNPTDWQAKWITYNQPPGEIVPIQGSIEAMTFNGAQWIWYPEGDPRKMAPEGSRYFRRVIDVSGIQVRRARMLLTVDDRDVVYVNGQEAFRSEVAGEPWRTPQYVDLTKSLMAGRNLVAVDGINARPSPAGFIGKIEIEYADGTKQTVVTDGSWRVADHKIEGWNQLVTGDAGFVAPMLLGAMGVDPWFSLRPGGDAVWSENRSSPVFRKTFGVEKALRSATVYVCGLGFCELRINGRKVGDHVLDPVFTRYDKRALYVTYDVTSMLQRGQNALGVMLGNGWYDQFSRDAWDFQRAPWRDRPKLLLMLRMVYSDGTQRVIGTDTTWQANTGPVIRDGIRNGEVYDARREMPGWDAPGFDASKWPSAQAATPPAGTLRAEIMPPCRVTQTFTPVSVKQPKPGLYVFDMGQAFAGWAQLRVQGPAGTKVTLKYGERLNDDGTVQRGQIETLVYEGPFQTDVYILKGKGLEVWEPRFVYHGYRYVEVEGLPGPVTVDNLRGRVVHTDFADAGSFECSNPLLNSVQKLTRWSYFSNFLGYPTDCPHREKNGWTGDAQLAAEQAMYNFDNAASYEKWMNDFKDEQPPNGELPGIVPTSGWGYGTGPSWDSAYVLIPWYLYLYTGDTRVLEEQYAGMKRYVDYLTTRQRGYIVDYGLGDWVPAKTDTPVAVTSTAYYYVDAGIVARTATLLGKNAEAAEYMALQKRICEAFNAAFYKGDGIYANGSQTALSCALYQGLAEPQERPKVLAQLIANIEKQGWHLDTGILGAKYVPNTLTDMGRADVAYRIATQTTPPSYGAWVKQGATTLWEDWYGGSSLDHIMFGDISAWFYKTLAGINLDPERPGFKHIIIRPRPVGDLTWVKASHRSPYGMIECDWRKDKGVFAIGVALPINTTATVYVPATAADAVREGNRPASESRCVRFVRMDDGCAVYEVESGAYRFESRGR